MGISPSITSNADKRQMKIYHLNITQSRLYAQASKRPMYATYIGRRQANAAYQLRDYGLLLITPANGYYWHRKLNGDYVRKYEPQGGMQPLPHTLRVKLKG